MLKKRDVALMLKQSPVSVSLINSQNKARNFLFADHERSSIMFNQMIKWWGGGPRRSQECAADKDISFSRGD